MAITIAELHAGPITQSKKSHRRNPKPPTRSAQRLQETRKERQRLLLHLAEERNLVADAESPGQYLVRDPGANGVTQITTAFGCTCRAGCVWRRCEHVALIRSLEGDCANTHLEVAS